MLGRVRGFGKRWGGLSSPTSPVVLPAPRPKPGGFLTEHDDIPLQEGASENKADFIRVVGSDESRLAVPEAVGPVLELIEEHRCARVCSGERAGQRPVGERAGADPPNLWWGSPHTRGDLDNTAFPLPSWRPAFPAPEALAALVAKGSMPVQGRLQGQGF